MGTHAVNDPDFMAEELSRFLKSPPDGTPAEVLQAFAAVADSDIVLFATGFSQGRRSGSNRNLHYR